MQRQTKQQVAEPHPADSLMGRQTPTQGDRKMNCTCGGPALPLGLGTCSSLLNPQPSSSGSRGICIVRVGGFSTEGPWPYSTAHSPHRLILCPSRLWSPPSVSLPCPGAGTTWTLRLLSLRLKSANCALMSNPVPVLPSTWSASPASHGSFLPSLSLIQLSPQLNIT